MGLFIDLNNFIRKSFKGVVICIMDNPLMHEPHKALNLIEVQRLGRYDY